MDGSVLSGFNGRRFSATADVFDVRAENYSPAQVVVAMRRRGFAVLRNLFSEVQVDEIIAASEKILRRPETTGVPGYFKVDYPKKVAYSTTLNASALNVLLDDRIVDVLEQYMESPIILFETFLKHDLGSNYVYDPIHSDFEVGWYKSARGEAKPLTDEDMGLPLGVGTMFYMHDTTEGALGYCDGTHEWRTPLGKHVANYPTEDREILKNLFVRIDGRKGDLVLFDKRGFHAPAHPTRSPRTAIQAAYLRVKTFGRIQVTPLPVFTSDLGKFTQTQLDVLGCGASYLVPTNEYKHTRFKKNLLYPLVCWIIENAYFVSYVKRRIGIALGRERQSRGKAAAAPTPGITGRHVTTID
jgi:hypothetical protein